MNSKIVILTGPSGTGKTTLINNLKEHLKSKGLTPIVFPSPARKIIDTNLDELRNEHIAYYLKQLLVLDAFTNRDEVVEELDNCVSKEDKVVIILDRCMLDNRVYLDTYLDVLDLPRRMRTAYTDTLDAINDYIRDFDALYKPHYFLMCPINDAQYIKHDGIRPQDLAAAQEVEYNSFLKFIKAFDLTVTQIEFEDRINFNTIVYDSIKDFKN
jgi:predicted ATPase